MIVKDIMNTEIQKVDAKVTVKEAAKQMTSKKVGCLMVVDDSRLAGIVTEDDIITKVVAEGKAPQTATVGDIMVRKVIHISPEKTLEEAAQIMTENRIKKLPVVESKKLVGIVTATDIVAAEPKMMDHLGELLLFAKRPQRIAG